MNKSLIIILSFSLFLSGCSRDKEEEPVNKEPAPKVAEKPAVKKTSPFTDEAKKAAEQINDIFIRGIVAEISADEYQGRQPASEGDKKARNHIAKTLEQIGFQPGAADGSWEQPFDLVGINAAQPETLKISGKNKSVTLKQGSEFIVASGVQKEQAIINDAEIVFVGYGINAPEYDWDDFKGMDVNGKILLIMNNDPDWDRKLFAGNRRLYYGRWRYKYENAARHGAAGAIIIHTTPSAGYPWQVVETSWSGQQFELPDTGEPRIQAGAWVSEDAAKKLVSLAGHKLDELMDSARSHDFNPVPLGITTSIKLDNEISSARSANVLGLLKGSDPKLADEVVIYTSHHDHLGIAEEKPGDDANTDRIYNGARDNASGVGMVLNIAKAFASLPSAPRRSILVALVGAEEQGLLGSQYFANNPTFSPGKLAANVNLDAANIWGRTYDITFIGMYKSSLDQVARDVARYQDRYVKPDQFPDRGYFYRSDQFSLARIGVPAIYLDGGTWFLGKEKHWGKEQINAYTQVNYHQPSDELSEDWNFEGIVEDARFAFWTGWIIANADEMPSWNKGDEFEATRLKALGQDK